MRHSANLLRPVFPQFESTRSWITGFMSGSLFMLAGCGGSGNDSEPKNHMASGDQPPAINPAVSKPSVAQQADTLEGLATKIQAGDASALATAFRRSMAMPNQPEVAPPAPTTSEIGSWKRITTACAESMDRFDAEARKVTMRLAGRMLVIAARDQVAVNWSDLLDPIRTVLEKGASDPDCEVRAAAIDQIGIIWEWVPGRDIFTVERNTLAAWKGSMLQLVQPHLKDTEIPSRLAAMRCLAALPIDAAAAPALQLLQDKEPFVRAETIRSFAGRSGLVTEEQLLSLSQDGDSMVSRSAELALKSRGISEQQITLGRAILSKNPQERIAVIGKLEESSDIDPGIWLARLVEDSDAAVRLKALEAIASRKVSRDLLRKIQVISEKDASDAVRKSAEKIIRSQNTASVSSSLPPLPPTFDAPNETETRRATLRAN
jgi:hypothetical protein